MKISRPLLAVLLLLVVAASATAHDLFLRPDSFFVPSNARVQVAVLNGTFDDSENAVDPARLADLALVTPAGRRALPHADWRAAGTRTMLRLRTDGPGTFLVGASTTPRSLTLTAADFKTYLEEDGLTDIRDARERAGEAGRAATERYSKHVKALLQVGARHDSGYAAVLGYPAEIVPLENPYTLHGGDTLRVRCLVDGRPAASQEVLVGGRSARTRRGAASRRFPELRLRTDAEGIARVPMPAPGQVYVKFIHMVPMHGQDGLDYESKWATLTFAVR